MWALVTGASSGIGKEIARELAGRGYNLILTGRDTQRLWDTRKMILERIPVPVRMEIMPADLSDEEACIRLHAQVRAGEKNGGQIDFLANCAGLGSYGDFAAGDLSRDLEVIAVNVTAVHILTKLFLRDMLRRGHGHILNVASSAGFMAGPEFAGYYASKNYVVRLSEAIHEELRHKHTGVTVSALCPGPVATDFDRRAGVRHSMHGLDPARVAREGVAGAMRGKMLIVPGFGMKAGLAASRLLGDGLLVRITYRIQKRKA